MKQITEHDTPAGRWCRWSLCTVSDHYLPRGCPDDCPDSAVEPVRPEHRDRGIEPRWVKLGPVAW